MENDLFKGNRKLVRVSGRFELVRVRVIGSRLYLYYFLLHFSLFPSLQAKEIQALQKRMQASHESHALELQNMQSQMRQLQEVVASSSMSSLQRLQEVKKFATCKVC